MNDHLAVIAQELGAHASSISEEFGYSLEQARHAFDNAPQNTSDKQYAEWWLKHQITTIKLQMPCYTSPHGDTRDHMADAFAGGLPWNPEQFDAVLAEIRKHQLIVEFDSLGEWGTEFKDSIFFEQE